ncbi:Uncharacterised protein [Neisseria dentiae]|nr:Uncharacterised protein [Neisseria dentiae]
MQKLAQILYRQIVEVLCLFPQKMLKRALMQPIGRVWLLMMEHLRRLKHRFLMEILSLADLSELITCWLGKKAAQLYSRSRYLQVEPQVLWQLSFPCYRVRLLPLVMQLYQKMAWAGLPTRLTDSRSTACCLNQRIYLSSISGISACLLKPNLLMLFDLAPTMLRMFGEICSSENQLKLQPAQAVQKCRPNTKRLKQNMVSFRRS